LKVFVVGFILIKNFNFEEKENDLFVGYTNSHFSFQFPLMFDCVNSQYQMPFHVKGSFEDYENKSLKVYTKPIFLVQK
jgi:hypothetical protein